MDKKVLITGLLLLIIGLLFLTPIFYIGQQPTKEFDVPCYDRYGNVLQGIDCIEERYVNPIVEEFSIIFALTAVLGLMFIIIGI